MEGEDQLMAYEDIEKEASKESDDLKEMSDEEPEKSDGSAPGPRVMDDHEDTTEETSQEADMRMRLEAITHAKRCTTQEKCKYKQCGTTKKLLEHKKSCRNEHTCNAPNCVSSHKAFTHSQTCNSVNCKPCKKVDSKLKGVNKRMEEEERERQKRVYAEWNYHLELLVQAERCRKEESSNQANRCTHPHCTATKELLTHMRTCDEEQCTDSSCSSARSLIAHWKSCSSDVCDICSGIEREQSNNVEEDDHEEEDGNTEDGNYNADTIEQDGFMETAHCESEMERTFNEMDENRNALDGMIDEAKNSKKQEKGKAETKKEERTRLKRERDIKEYRLHKEVRRDSSIVFKLAAPIGKHSLELRYFIGEQNEDFHFELQCHLKNLFNLGLCVPFLKRLRDDGKHVDEFNWKMLNWNDIEELPELLDTLNNVMKPFRKLRFSATLTTIPEEFRYCYCDAEQAKMICDLAFNRAVDDATVLNTSYEGFSSFVYGEVHFVQIRAILDRLQPNKNDVIVDMGSGVGHVITFAAAYTQVKRCVGIELNTIPSEMAKDMTTEFKGLMDWYGKKCSYFELKDGDFLDKKFRKLITEDATIIWCNNFAFDAKLTLEIKSLIWEMPNGTRILCTKSLLEERGAKDACSTTRSLHRQTIDMILDEEIIPTVDSKEMPVSWSNGARIQFILYTINHSKLGEIFKSGSGESSDTEDDENNEESVSERRWRCWHAFAFFEPDEVTYYVFHTRQLVPKHRNMEVGETAAMWWEGKYYGATKIHRGTLRDCDSLIDDLVKKIRTFESLNISGIPPPHANADCSRPVSPTCSDDTADSDDDNLSFMEMDDDCFSVSSRTKKSTVEFTVHEDEITARSRKRMSERRGDDEETVGRKRMRNEGSSLQKGRAEFSEERLECDPIPIHSDNLKSVTTRSKKDGKPNEQGKISPFTRPPIIASSRRRTTSKMSQMILYEVSVDGEEVSVHEIKEGENEMHSISLPDWDHPPQLEKEEETTTEREESDDEGDDGDDEMPDLDEEEETAEDKKEEDDELDEDNFAVNDEIFAKWHACDDFVQPAVVEKIEMNEQGEDIMHIHFDKDSTGWYDMQIRAEQVPYQLFHKQVLLREKTLVPSPMYKGGYIVGPYFIGGRDRKKLNRKIIATDTYKMDEFIFGRLPNGDGTWYNAKVTWIGKNPERQTRYRIDYVGYKEETPHFVEAQEVGILMSKKTEKERKEAKEEEELWEKKKQSKKRSGKK